MSLWDRLISLSSHSTSRLTHIAEVRPLIMQLMDRISFRIATAVLNRALARLIRGAAFRLFMVDEIEPGLVYDPS